MKKILAIILVIILLIMVSPAPVLAGDLMESFEDNNTYASYYGINWMSQTFTATSNYNMDGVLLYIARYGAGGINYTVSIRDCDVDGKPTGSNLISKTRSTSEFSTSANWVTFAFDSTIPISSGEKYSIIMESTNGTSGNNVRWSLYTSGGYSGGQRWDSNNYGATWDDTGLSGHDFDFRTYGTIVEAQEPSVNTYKAMLFSDAVNLYGWANGHDYPLVDIGFQWGNAADNLTYSVNNSSYLSANQTNIGWQDSRTYPTDGATWYFRAYATTTEGGTGYGEILSFTNILPSIEVTTLSGQVFIGGGGGWAIAFPVQLYSYDYSDNFTIGGRVGTSLDTWLYNTANDTLGILPSGVQHGYPTWTVYSWGQDQTEYNLADNTTYYYQGFASDNSTTYYGNVLTISTGINTEALPSPTLTITKIVNIENSTEIVFDVTAKITNNNIEYIIDKGFQFSLSAINGVLSGDIHTWTVMDNLGTDGLYHIRIFEDYFPWYDYENGETVYIRAWARNNSGMGYSSVISYNPVDAAATMPTSTGTLPEISQLVRNTKTSLGMDGGIMGSWAFMGIIILLIALVFGIAMITAKESMARMAIGVAWLLASIAVVGAFIFTGELGIWPIIVLVGGVVGIILIVASAKLSGSQGV